MPKPFFADLVTRHLQSLAFVSRWRSRPNDPDRIFNIAIMVSIALHLVVLSIKFVPDLKPYFKATERPLEIVLVNAKSRNKPTEAQVLAQNNLDGGGNTDEDRRLRTPLPPSANTREGDALVETRQRIQQLEKQTQALLTQTKGLTSVSTEIYRTPPVEASELTNGVDLRQNALAIARLEGQIDKQIDEYNKRPRKRFFGARAEEYRFAQYIEDWRQKIERIGSLNYPEAARGRLYGSVRVAIAVRKDGSVKTFEVLQSSGHPVLDSAVGRIVKLAEPFSRFPREISHDTDEIEIVRTWVFTNADRLRTE